MSRPSNDRAAGARGAGRGTPSRPVTPRYPDRGRPRMALAPGVLVAIILLAGFALIGTDGYVFVLYAVAILAAVMCWFAFQARAFWWLLGLAPMVIAWNPIVPLALPDPLWASLHLIGVGVAVAAGLVIRVPVAD